MKRILSHERDEVATVDALYNDDYDAEQLRWIHLGHK
jgi:hypothetical protein